MTEPRFRGVGKFVWHDLMTTDLESALDYYPALFGWEIVDTPMGEGDPYKLIEAGGVRQGGMIVLDAEHGIPSHWMGYVTVRDVDETCREAVRLRGKVCVAATDLPGVGRFAVIEDPTGAVVSPFVADEPGEVSPKAPPPGHFCWDELLATDAEKAGAFFAKLFSWEVEEVELGPQGVYRLFKNRGRERAGMITKPPDAPGRSAWLPHVRVEDVDAASRRAEELGGKLLKPPTDIPDVGRFAVTADPGGALVAVYAGTPV